jgi:hypothetical protein
VIPEKAREQQEPFRGKSKTMLVKNLCENLQRDKIVHPLFEYLHTRRLYVGDISNIPDIQVKRYKTVAATNGRLCQARESYHKKVRYDAVSMDDGSIVRLRSLFEFTSGDQTPIYLAFVQKYSYCNPRKSKLVKLAHVNCKGNPEYAIVEATRISQLCALYFDFSDTTSKTFFVDCNPYDDGDAEE